MLSDVVVENFGTVLGRSQCLVLSLKDTVLSAGHMVMLQALAEDIPVIVNRIHAVEDYVSDEDVLFSKAEILMIWQIRSKCFCPENGSPKGQENYMRKNIHSRQCLKESSA